MKSWKICVALLTLGALAIPIAGSALAEAGDGEGAPHVGPAGSAAASTVGTAAEIAPISEAAGSNLMPESFYDNLASGLADNAAETNRELSPRSESLTLFTAADGRTISAVTSEDGSICIMAGSADQLISGGCSQHLRVAGIEPMVSTTPSLEGDPARTDVYGLIASDVTDVEVELPGGETVSADMSDWAYWWTSNTQVSPVAIIVHRGTKSERFEY